MAVAAVLNLICAALVACHLWSFHASSFELMRCEAPPPLMVPQYREFEQHSSEFWAYDQKSKRWKSVDISKILCNQDQVKAADIAREHMPDSKTEVELPLEAYRGRVSVMKFSDNSIWITGQSGSIYERFWNGIQWVIIPHDLPHVAGQATNIYSVNRTMVALSEAGYLYQLQIDNSGQLQWISSGPRKSSDAESDVISLRKSGMLSNDESSLYFSTSEGWLAELLCLHPVRWTNHGYPRGGDVATIVDAGSFKAGSGVVFTVSTSGDLYEYDEKVKPAWKKHIRTGSILENSPLAPTSGVVLHDLAGHGSASIFLMTKEGHIVERRFAQAKWRWISHAKPNIRLSFSLGPVILEKLSTTTNVSFFLTSEDGHIYEYRLWYLHGVRRSTGVALENGLWISHRRPGDAAIVKGVAGVVYSEGRIIFPLENGCIGELHKHGVGGAETGPLSRSHKNPKKQSLEYTWSVWEAPESEGGNAEYCSASLGPSNCLEGTKDESTHSDLVKQKGRFRRALVPNSLWNQSLGSLFQIRTLQFGKSIFVVGKDGVAAERFYNGEAWLWLKHEFSTAIHGIVGVYNGSVFMTDSEGSLLIREWHENTLQWLNCTAMDGGTKVFLGSPWDGMFGEARTVTLEDAQFYVSESGDLMQFTVALRKFEWKNFGHPPSVRIAAIADQEILRYRVVFVVGYDGKLYHFNRITSHWHSHQQPNYITLSKVPAVVYRPSFQSTLGSLFMRSEDGNLVEFHWRHSDGWVWTDHGSPSKEMPIITSPGPCVGNGHVFVITSDGEVHSRYLIDNEWRWQHHGRPLADFQHPSLPSPSSDIANHDDSNKDMKKPDVFVVEDNGKAVDVYVSFDGECTTSIDAVRPVAFSKDSAFFFLRDGRLAELKQVEEDTWNWISIIDTPTSSCHSNYWAAT